MIHQFQALADEYGLVIRSDNCPPGAEACRYLYSREKRERNYKYRYAYAECWGAEQSLATSIAWVLLNPAKGDTDKTQRRTLETCRKHSQTSRYARNKSYSGLVIVNVFPYRATDVKELRRLSRGEAEGALDVNDRVLEVITRDCARVVAAWGNDGALHGRSAIVRPKLKNPYCLQKNVGGRWQDTTKSGEPFHPARAADDAKLIRLLRRGPGG